MKLAIIGFGAMGRRIKEIALERGNEVVAVIDPNSSEATAHDISAKTLMGADTAIDFTHPDTAIRNIEAVLEAKVNLVMGTTGWYQHLNEVEAKVKKAGGGVLWSSNFSIGVNVYFKILESAAKLMNQFDEYDVWGQELHHVNKVDSPSGTAKTIEKIILENVKRKTAVVEEKLDRKIKPNEFHFSSVRGGAVNFSHTVGFDSPADVITVTHSARNRDGYALGAVKAAEWLKGKTGFYGMEDFLTL